MILCTIIVSYLIGCASTYLAVWVQFEEHFSNGYLQGYKDGVEAKKNRME